MKFVVVGAGVVGSSLSLKLSALGHHVCLVDSDAQKLSAVINVSRKIETVYGSGASPETLVAAGLENADYLLAVADSDEVNIASCFIGRLITPTPKRIARVRYFDLNNPEISASFLSEYFDLIINPDQAAADSLVRTLDIPGAHEVLEFGKGGIRVLGLTIAPNSPLSNMKLSTFKDWPQQLPILIVAVMRGSQLIIPKGDDKIKTGDIIYAVSLPGKTKLLFELAGKKLADIRRVLLSVNDRLAFTLVKTLQSQVDNITVLVPNLELKNELQSTFKRLRIITGQASDQNSLLECGVTDCDAFISATSDDENNVLTALLAKRLGAKNSGCFVSNESYGPLVSAIGVDIVINLRQAAANAIFQHIHHRSIISELALQNEGAGFVEVEWDQNLPFINKKLKDLTLPHGIIIAGIERGSSVIIPNGEDALALGDKVLIFLLRAAQPKLEKLLGFQLELFV